MILVQNTLTDPLEKSSKDSKLAFEVKIEVDAKVSQRLNIETPISMKNKVMVPIQNRMVPIQDDYSKFY